MEKNVFINLFLSMFKNFNKLKDFNKRFNNSLLRSGELELVLNFS